VREGNSVLSKDGGVMRGGSLPGEHFEALADRGCNPIEKRYGHGRKAICSFPRRERRSTCLGQRGEEPAFPFVMVDEKGGRGDERGGPSGRGCSIPYGQTFCKKSRI